jgi:alpha-tubulin suppressor-like RCC1 family protein
VQVSGTTWSAVSASGSHTCATKTDNTLWCWGSNDRGQLGTGDLINATSPAQTAGITVVGAMSQAALGDTTFVITG